MSVYTTETLFSNRKVFFFTVTNITEKKQQLANTLFVHDVNNQTPELEFNSTGRNWNGCCLGTFSWACRNSQTQHGLCVSIRRTGGRSEAGRAVC